MKAAWIGFNTDVSKLALFLLLLALAGAAAAQAIDAPPSAFRANEGIVRSVDRAAGEIIIRHGPLPEMDMPPMTMAFDVSDPAFLDKVNTGDAVAFRVELLNGRFTVTSIDRRRNTRDKEP
jgi:Cu/Ag efflux protein CusF